MYSSSHRDIRYEPDEIPPVPLTLGLALQLAVLSLAGIVLGTAIVVRAANGTEAYLSWAVFASIAISGVATVMQAVRFGRIGAGYVLTMGTSGAFIAICVTALVEGGPAMLATLVVISSFFQFALAARLSLFRRILTPTVAGTVIMLIPVTVMPIIFNMLKEVPEGTPVLAAALSALVTMLVIGGFVLKAKGVLRLWGVVIGVFVGSIVSWFLGIYDVQRVVDAAWIGLPQNEWSGIDLSFGPVFWALLPAFVFVTLIGAIETISDSVTIQHVSWRRPRAVDFRAVQGALAADGMGNLLSGLAGTVPNTTYSTTISLTELTGVSARTVGIYLGILFVALAFLPKAIALILAIPSPVAAAYVTVLLSMLFVLGMKVVIAGGVDYRKGLIVGIAFWVGTGFQNGLIYPEFVADFAGGILQNGMTAGGLLALIMTMIAELTEPRRKIEVAFDVSSLQNIRTFLEAFTSRHGWNMAMTHRLVAASEETLLMLLQRDEDSDTHEQRRLLLTARKEDNEVVLEFVAAPGKENLQDRIALVGEHTVPIEREISLQLLRHLASSVDHQQYHDTDIVIVRVEILEHISAKQT